MAEPDRRDEQSAQDYEVSTTSDTERGDAQQSRSTGEGDRRRLRSDGNFINATEPVVEFLYLATHLCSYAWQVIEYIQYNIYLRGNY